MARLFISYSRNDADFARKLAKSLSNLGGDIWIDVEDIPAGMNWSSVIQQGLQFCDVMIVILTPGSAASRNVEEEWQYYRDKSKPVIPVLLQPAEVHYQLSRIQYIDFHTQDYDTALRQLHTQLRHKGVVLKPISASEKSIPIPAQKPLPLRLSPSVQAHLMHYLPVWLLAGVVLLTAINQAALNNSGQGGQPTPTATDTPIPLGFPGNPVLRNDDWTPMIQDFDGVVMALVPVGCFMMGSEDGGEDERPVHRQCFNEPFWIDLYEVTNGQFAQFGGVAANPGDWSDPQQPRTNIFWFEARDFCELRGTRLPTETEWEYAARGPDSLVYPWGNEFVGDNVVYEENSDEAAEVGSRSGGISWVRAYDMSGNVWEWVNTIYDNTNVENEFPYPYDPNDGREDLNRTDVLRVLRGGSFNFSEFSLRAAYRFWFDPDYGLYFIGFRCALSE